MCNGSQRWKQERATFVMFVIPISIIPGLQTMTPFRDCFFWRGLGNGVFLWESIWEVFFLSLSLLPSFLCHTFDDTELNGNKFNSLTLLQCPWFGSITGQSPTKLHWQHLPPLPDSAQMHRRLSNHPSHSFSLLLLTGIKPASFYRFCRV